MESSRGQIERKGHKVTTREGEGWGGESTSGPKGHSFEVWHLGGGEGRGGRGNEGREKDGPGSDTGLLGHQARWGKRREQEDELEEKRRGKW